MATSSSVSLIPPTIIRPIHQAAFKPRRSLNLPPDPSILSGRAMQLNDRRIGIQPCAPASDGLCRYMVNCCNLIWPVNQKQFSATVNHTERKQSLVTKDDNTWQFPVEIISYRHPGFSVYGGLLVCILNVFCVYLVAHSFNWLGNSDLNLILQKANSIFQTFTLSFCSTSCCLQ